GFHCGRFILFTPSMYVSRCGSRIAPSVTIACGFLLIDGWPRRPRKAQGFWPRSRLDSTSKRNDSSRPDLLLEQVLGDRLRGWACRIRTSESVRGLANWNCMTTWPEGECMAI